MGRNQWRNEQEWPLERTQYTAYYWLAIDGLGGPSYYFRNS